MSTLPAEVQEEIRLLQEKRWRIQARNSLATYAKTVPIPGVPQTDNYEQLLETGLIVPKRGDNGKEWYDGRYDGSIIIPQIDTAPAAHHILIYQNAQAIIEGTLIHEGEVCRRMMIMTPPGAAKSTTMCVVTASWAIGKHGHEVILASCADMIAKKHGKRARQLVQSPEHFAIFEMGIDPKTQAADLWATTNGGMYLSAGIHGSLMGQRSDGAIGDDLLKGRRAAESQTERDNAWDAYKDDFRTRKKPNAWEMLSGTRWHEDDVMGRILPEGWAGESGFIRGRDGYLWYVICLQAEVETNSDPLGRKMGEYLWPEWFQDQGDPAKYWLPLKLDERSWSSLYQQVPTPPTGTFFKNEWVRRYDYLPQHLNYFVSADYATSEETTADYSSIGLWGVDSENQAYFVKGWHGQADPATWTEIALDFVGMKGALAHIAGKGTIRRMSEGPLTVRMRKRKVFTELVWYEESYGKEVNAKPFAMMMAAGMVFWPREDEEAEWVIRHLLGFGTLTIDDPVDMCSMFGRHMERIWGPAKPREEKAPPIIENPGVVKFADVIKRRKRK